MENGLSGQLVTDNHVLVTDDGRRSKPDCDIPCVNFGHVSCSIQHNIAAETICDRKPNGKCDVSQCTIHKFNLTLIPV